MDLSCRHSSSLRIAITGANGYIGSRLINAFGSDEFVATTVSSLQQPSLIIHLAANVSPTREAMMTNLEMDSWLVDKINDTKHLGLIYASSNNVYPKAINCKIDETPRCHDYYAASKIFGEKIVLNMSHAPTIVLRIADVFGFNQRHGNLFKAIENAVIERSAFQQYGKGLKRRTYIHVDELCKIIVFLASRIVNGVRAETIFNIGYEDSASVAEILELVAEMTQLPIRYTPTEPDSSCFDIRTMDISFPHEYSPKWPNLRAALHNYVSQISSIDRNKSLS